MSETSVPRRIPEIVVYLHPFRMVVNDDIEPWKTTLEEINSHSWDYTYLHKVIGGLDIGLPQPYHMLVGADGALALPPIPELRGDKEAVEFFNRCLAVIRSRRLLVTKFQCKFFKSCTGIPPSAPQWVISRTSPQGIPMMP